MLKKTIYSDIVDASMWNMAGLVLIGFEQDYEDLRDRMHIPFVVYDGFAKRRYYAIIIDDLQEAIRWETISCKWDMKNLFAADNDESMIIAIFRFHKEAVKEHIEKKVVRTGRSKFLAANAEKKKYFLQNHMDMIKSSIVCASDAYAID